MNKITILSKPPAYGFVDEWYEVANADHFWMEWRLRAFLKQLKDLKVPTGEPWLGLDIGCGSGVFCRQLESYTNWIVDGTDVNEQALRMHHERKGKTLLYDIHERRPDLAEAYDFIVLFDVLEHIQETERYLDSALFHLKPGGWIFVNVPALELLRSAYDRAVGHLRRYTRRTVQTELNSHSLDVRDVRYWGASMIPALILRTLLTSDNQSPKATMQKGFQPPHPSINSFLKAVMAIETRLISHPLAGTSVLAAAVKR